MKVSPLNVNDKNERRLLSNASTNPALSIQHFIKKSSMNFGLPTSPAF
jgi:hypothetical protein